VRQWKRRSAALVALVQSSDPPPPLTGEQLLGTSVTTTASCDPDGTSVFHYEATGVAIGPISGDFEFLTESFQSSLALTQAVKPGKGCGDKNHAHEREAECRKPAR
jgi:hypothetical protein